MNVIESKNLTKSYGNFKALRELSFTIKENTITGLIGRNGAGKTTLLKTISGFYHPTSGDIRVYSENPFNNLKISSNLIFIDDHMVFPPGLNLGDLLKSAEYFYPNWDAELAKRLFDYFDLRPKMSHHHLSKGMKSTFNMIIGLSSRCAVTIFDEPTTGMDASVRKDFYKALLKDYIEIPRTIIFSSHLLNEIDSFLEDILLIKSGEKVLHMPVIDLKEYAIGLSGKTEAVNQITQYLEIIHQETFGNGSSYTVVRNIFPDSTRNEMKKLGIDLLPVPTDDLCVYLTAKNKGGIDDVFNRG
ncbi:ABC transporter ATP-binding protein [Ferdinandcohnia quinoae]|uniref:ABC transporter ATP-binding protein n=1 Tax=Fredinandcohnia quinoae TaxID=2918902 RepID=A0AAW5E1Y3_9BACI|nr:ABC transporter ATP-binding protein [Fredinandcohnia sp. SECRCQ15]MCH1624087.1 ABC transporter ATP-binding protein [Fredinandcohnia sp. SECRCQ15]